MSLPKAEDDGRLRERLLSGLTLTAPAMIVTIYGDMVVPRGGTLWMGSLIEICDAFGISETQVRTAVSRLVNSGQLTGIRDGRRSYYSLADTARDEFDRAARLLFEAIPPAEGWTVLHARDLTPEMVRRHNLGAIGNGVFLRPNHAHFMPACSGIEFIATLVNGAADLAAQANTLWPIEAQAAEYRSFIDRFSPLAERLSAGELPSERDGVLARLALVHLYRRIRLADPILPADILPADWPGAEASNLFAKLYLALSPCADVWIGQSFQGRDGLLPDVTEATARRMAGVRALFQPTNPSS